MVVASFSVIISLKVQVLGEAKDECPLPSAAVTKTVHDYFISLTYSHFFGVSLRVEAEAFCFHNQQLTEEE